MMDVTCTSYSDVRDGSVEARRIEFERLMKKSWRRAYTMAFQLTRNRSDAEDLVQDTFVKAWKGFASFRPERPFINWVLRIMQRAFLDLRRRDNPVRTAESLNGMISPSDGEIQEIPIPDRSPGPEDSYLSQEVRREVTEALGTIPDVYRAAVVLCDIEGLSYAEIAEVQGTTVGTVRSRIHRGRQMLKKELARRQKQ
ncbi:MAG: sigma-70 family RNA polymerase sigma factor [Fimbriimonadia bacterium]|jgi:RNA polymerase sigma-70 factor (ECF subfamily)